MSLLQRIEKQRTTVEEIPSVAKSPPREEKKDKYEELKNKIHKEIIEKMDKELKHHPSTDDILSQKAKEFITSILDRDAGHLPYSERQTITGDIMDEVLGYGPLEALLKNDAITEIMVN